MRRTRFSAEPFLYLLSHPQTEKQAFSFIFFCLKIFIHLAFFCCTGRFWGCLCRPDQPGSLKPCHVHLPEALCSMKQWKIHKWFAKEELGILSWSPFHLWCSIEPKILHSVPVSQSIMCISSCLSPFQQHVTISSCVLLLCYLYWSSRSCNHQNCQSVLYRYSVWSFSLEAVSQELHDKPVTGSRREAKERKWYTPTLCSFFAVWSQ